MNYKKQEVQIDLRRDTQKSKPPRVSKFLSKLSNIRMAKMEEKVLKWGFDFELERPVKTENETPVFVESPAVYKLKLLAP